MPLNTLRDVCTLFGANDPHTRSHSRWSSTEHHGAPSGAVPFQTAAFGLPPNPVVPPRAPQVAPAPQMVAVCSAYGASQEPYARARPANGNAEELARHEDEWEQAVLETMRLLSNRRSR